MGILLSVLNFKLRENFNNLIFLCSMQLIATTGSHFGCQLKKVKYWTIFMAESQFLKRDKSKYVDTHGYLNYG